MISLFNANSADSTQISGGNYVNEGWMKEDNAGRKSKFKVKIMMYVRS